MTALIAGTVALVVSVASGALMFALGCGVGVVVERRKRPKWSAPSATETFDAARFAVDDRVPGQIVIPDAMWDEGVREFGSVPVVPRSEYELQVEAQVLREKSRSPMYPRREGRT